MQLTDEPDKRCYPLEEHLLCHTCHLNRIALAATQTSNSPHNPPRPPPSTTVLYPQQQPATKPTPAQVATKHAPAKKESKQASILGAIASKFSRKKHHHDSSKTDQKPVVSASKTTNVDPSPPASPKITTPPPLPDKKSRDANIFAIAKEPESFDYWEEPIYEPLEKIRGMKKERKDTVIAVNKISPRLLSVDSSEAVTSQKNAMTSVSAGGEVKTLREVYKHSLSATEVNEKTSSQELKSPNISKSKSAAELPLSIPPPDYEVDQEPPAPPVPPKNFADESDASQQNVSNAAAAIAAAKSALKKVDIQNEKAESPSTKQKANQKKTTNGSNATQVNSRVKVTNTSTAPSKGSTTSATASKTNKTTTATEFMGKIKLRPTAVQSGKQTSFAVTSSKHDGMTSSQSAPFLIKNVTSSNRKSKGTTVLIEDSPSPVSTVHSGVHIVVPKSVTSPGAGATQGPFIAVARVGDNFSNNGLSSSALNKKRHSTQM